MSRCVMRLVLAAMMHLSMVASTASELRAPKCIMYLTGQHDVVPSQDSGLVSGISHVILAFMRSEVFNLNDVPSEFPLFTTVGKTRARFDQATKISVAIGGWGDWEGFAEGARNDGNRQRWAANVGAMVNTTGADGVDIDWEYPGGNRDDYKVVPNKYREWEIEAFVQLLAEIRSAIGPEKLLSVAVPGLERDLMAFTADTLPRIVEQVDFISVMTYDLMNRRDTLVKHHSGLDESREALQRYIDRGAPAHMLNLGLGYYVKWFETTDCDAEDPLGCPTQLLEDPDTGADLGRTAGFSWHDPTPFELEESFARALKDGQYFSDGSFGYYDAEEARWWSLDTPRSILRKVHDVALPMGLGGVFAWGLGEDAPEFRHLEATLQGVKLLADSQAPNSEVRDEL